MISFLNSFSGTDPSWRLLYYNSRQLIQVSGFNQLQYKEDKKEPTAEAVGFMLALPIFPGSHPPSIVGANELNFCVRDGNRWTLIAINTNSYGWVLTHLLFQSPVGLRCCGLLVTHTGFEPMLTA